MKIAILGAESTGKSQLASDLASALRSQGKTVSPVNEYLREWCDQHGRTPRRDEQALIAHGQVQRVKAADAARDQIVVADTTALMTAAYSELLFNDVSLYDFAIAHHRSYDITLLTGLDLPWVADGLQRDGPHTREAFDNLLRKAMGSASLPYHVVYGKGAVRAANALQTIDATLSIANYLYRTSEKCISDSQKQPKTVKPVKMVEGATWAWPCDKCSDPDCEHRLFSQLLQQTPVASRPDNPL